MAALFAFILSFSRSFMKWAPGSATCGRREGPPVRPLFSFLTPSSILNPAPPVISFACNVMSVIWPNHGLMMLNSRKDAEWCELDWTLVSVSATIPDSSALALDLRPRISLRRAGLSFLSIIKPCFFIPKFYINEGGHVKEDTSHRVMTHTRGRTRERKKSILFQV